MLFTPYDSSQMHILDVQPCTEKYVFHGSGKDFSTLSPAFHKPTENGNYEFGEPVVFGHTTPSGMFCYEPTEQYQSYKEKYRFVFHRLYYKNRHILLGAKLKGFIYVFLGQDFYRIEREDWEIGKWEKGVEYISTKEVTPIDKIPILAPYDCEMLEAYEFLGQEYVGLMSAQEYIKLAKDPYVCKEIQTLLDTPFIPVFPKGLEKYYPPAN
ncbi:MAG: hypothetical protein ACK4NC_05680 [Candidatus Gracilibacteria bacterium]